MFPYLSYGAMVFVLFAGFALGVIFGWGLKDINWRSYFDGDGGKILKFVKRQPAAKARLLDDNVIEFPQRRAS